MSQIFWIQKWEESERGWGSRPDGYTIHKVKEDINFMLANMRKKEEERGYSETNPPDEYTRPDGRPYQAEIQDEAIIKLVLESPFGIWGKNGHNYPKCISE